MPRTPPPPLGLTLTLLRSARGWSQKEVAEAAGLSRGLLSEYETGTTELTRERLVELAAILGWPPDAVDLALFTLGTMRFAPTGPSTAVGPDEEQRRIIDRAAAVAAQEAAMEVRAQLTREARQENARRARLAAERLWARLKAFSFAEQRVLVAGAREFQDPFVCELLCYESLRSAAGSAKQARQLAQLALLVAEHVPGSPAWRSRLQGYAWAFIANAFRVANDLPASDHAFTTAWGLWGKGSGIESELLDEARLLDLEASLRWAQRKFTQALDLHDRALAAAKPRDLSHILLNKAAILEESGDYEASIAALDGAAPYVDGEREPRQTFALLFNKAVNLLHLSRLAEAEPLIEQARSLAVKLGYELDLVRLLWLEGRVLFGRGSTEQAVAAFEQVRREFAARGMAYDCALASLELSALWLEQERTGEVKALAQQMVWIFRAQGVHREGLAALKLFREAAEKEELTVEVARRLLNYLTKARHDPSLRFEA